ncbi:MAG: outer membrane lipid asymmetry maintenance protein MlaD [Betaproteobacteria bacterium]
MNRKAVDILVGLFVLLGFGALVFLAIRAGNMSSSLGLGETYSVSAKFDNIGGLKPRAAVRSAGVVVGRVVSVGLDGQTFQAVVRLEIDRRFSFPKDTSAKILTAGLLGEQYIGLEPGADSAMLGPGGTLTLTQSAVVLENIIGQFLYLSAAEGEKK